MVGRYGDPSLFCLAGVACALVRQILSLVRLSPMNLGGVGYQIMIAKDLVSYANCINGPYSSS